MRTHLGFLAIAVPALVTAGYSSRTTQAPPAQDVPPPAQQACTVDTTAAWHRTQRAWLAESAHTWNGDSLRAAMLAAAGMKEGAAIPVQLGFQITGPGVPVGPAPTMASAIGSLRGLPRGAAWPTRSVVGPAGTRAVWQMAVADTGFANMAMHRMMEAGPDESMAADVATLEDRVRLQAGRKQIYGTQLRKDAQGRITLAPMEDSAHADFRREAAGLPPLALSLCLARK